MDITGGLFLFFAVLCIMMCCGWCCTKKRRGAVLSTPVVVTSATHVPPGGYGVNQMPPSGTAYQSNVYVAPYPTQSAPGQMPMPMPLPPGHAPAPGMQGYPGYPPVQVQASMNPPSYDMVVTGSAGGQGNTVPYEKQAPYNPSFTAH